MNSHIDKPADKNDEKLEKLRKLYANKCSQIEHAQLSPDELRYRVMKAEADMIKAELDHSC